MNVLIVDDRHPVTRTTMMTENPLGMTTGEIASATTQLESLVERHTARNRIRIATQCRARLAALRVELIRRTS